MTLPFEKYLVVTDVDGTMLTYDKVLPSRNIEAVNRFKAKGGKFTFATGRSIESARNYVNVIAPNVPAILFNGTAIYDYLKEKIIYNFDMPDNSKDVLIDILTQFPLIGCGIHTIKTLYIVVKSELTEHYIKNEKMRFVYADINSTPKVWQKIIFMAPPKQCDELEQYIRSLKLQNMQCMRSSEIYVELLPYGHNKGTALLALADSLNIKRENIVGIGDFYNDLELVSFAGIGVATANAVKEVKDAADLVVCDCRFGAVAEVIEYIEKIEKAH